MNQYTVEIINKITEVSRENERLKAQIEVLDRYLDAQEEEGIADAERWKERDIRTNLSLEEIRNILGLKASQDHAARIAKLKNPGEDSDTKK